MDFNFKWLIDVFYPPLCLHCQTRLAFKEPLFCATCLEQITLIEGQERCRVCFAELGKGRCERCSHRPVIVHRQLAACEAFGPAQTLVHALNQGRKECIPAAASLMAYQWLKHNLPIPDFLIPLPLSFWQKQRHGFDLNRELCQELSKLFTCSMCSALKLRFDRKHFLAEGEFKSCFQPIARKQKHLVDRHLLLIAPTLDDAQLRQAASELKAAFPTRIDALTFCINS
jgi:predicted amidophosphoribosyltransferase